MKISEMVAIIENNPELKKQFIDNCIEHFGTDIIQKEKQRIPKTQDVDELVLRNIPIEDELNYGLQLYELEKTVGAKQYNEKKVIQYLIEKKTTLEIIQILKISQPTLQEIKNNIYVKLKERRDQEKD